MSGARAITVLLLSFGALAAARGQEPLLPEAAADKARAAALDAEADRLYDERRYAEAEKAVRGALAIHEAADPQDPVRISASLLLLGLCQRKQGAYAEGRATYERALALAEPAVGEDHGLVRALKNNFATLLRATGDYAKAAQLLEAVIAQGERLNGKDSPRLATPLLNLAIALRAARRPVQARAAIERCLAILEATYPAEHPRVASARMLKGRILRDLGAPLEALALVESALASLERAAGPEHPEVATALMHLAGISMDIARFGEAVPAARRAVAIRAAVYGEDHVLTSEATNLLGLALRQMGEIEEAVALQRQSLAICEKTYPPDHPQVPAALVGLAQCLLDAGAFEEAEGLCRRALSVHDLAADPPAVEVALTVATLAKVLRWRGNLGEARLLHERSVRMHEEALGPEHLDLAPVLHGLGSVLHRLGALEEAHVLLERALAIWEQRLGPDAVLVASGLAALGHVELDQRDTVRARQRFERARAIRKLALSEDDPRHADSLADLALVLARDGDLSGALALLHRARSHLVAAIGKGHPDAFAITVDIANQHYRAREYADALREARAGLHGMREALGPQHPSLARAHGMVAFALRATGDGPQAVEHMRKALDLAWQRVWTARVGTTADERLRLKEELDAYLGAWLAMTADPEIKEDGYAEVLRCKGITARFAAAERRAQRRLEGAERALYDAWVRAERRLAMAAYAAAEGRRGAARRYAEAFEHCQQLGLDISRRSGAIRDLEAEARMGLPQIQARLGEDQALVDVVSYEGRYAAWVLRRKGLPRRVELGAEEVLEPLVVRFVAAVREAARPDDPALLRAGAALRAALWAPIAKVLGPRARVVYLVPDGALLRVPFAALPGSASHRNLIDEYVLCRLASAQDLVVARRPSPERGGALLLGGVAYDAPGGEDDPAAVPPPEGSIVAGVATLRRARTGSFAPLPGTRAEVESIARLMRARRPAEADSGRSTALILTGADATESALREAAPGRRILHLATHGFARAQAAPLPIGDAPLPGHLLRHEQSRDPLVLSGVALAGASRGDDGQGDDGILTALEAASLPLDGVELCVLSACDTAGGRRTAGEGVLGLVRGFREAGARRVVASLWPVDDEATRRLMVSLYGELESGSDGTAPAEALRAAALALRTAEVVTVDPRAALLTGRPARRTTRPFAAPRYWAAFVAYGPLR